MTLNGKLPYPRGLKKASDSGFAAWSGSLGQQYSTSTHRWPIYSSHCGLVRDYKVHANTVRIDKAKILERLISCLLLLSSMSLKDWNKTTPLIQSHAGPMANQTVSSLEKPPTANLDSVKSTSAMCLTYALSQDVTPSCPDTSRPTHSGISEPVGNNRTPEDRAKA